MPQSPDPWNECAPTFDIEPDHGLLDDEVREAWDALLRSVLGASPLRIADLGCGTGSLSVLLAQAGHDVCGIDFATEMLAVARAKATQAGVTVDFVTADAAAPPLPAASYDVVLSRHVLWALPDPAAALETWIDVLRPDGLLLLIEGRWHTGAGIAADDARRLVLEFRQEAEIRSLHDQPSLWGRAVDDERYLLLSRR